VPGDGGAPFKNKRNSPQAFPLGIVVARPRRGAATAGRSYGGAGATIVSWSSGGVVVASRERRGVRIARASRVAEHCLQSVKR